MNLHHVNLHHVSGAVLCVLLLLENCGLPLPGELALLYAGYHVRAQGFWGLWLAASTACVLGQMAGYGFGRFFGLRARRWLCLDGQRQLAIAAYVERHGPLAIVCSRFIYGLRSLAGPIAGLYRMRWRRFMICNVLGAAVWVAAVGRVGVLAGVHGARLARLVNRGDLLALAAAIAVIALTWRRLQYRSVHE